MPGDQLSPTYQSDLEIHWIMVVTWMKPRRLTAWNLKMMVWLRWFCDFPGGPYSQVPAVNFPGCTVFVASKIGFWSWASRPSHKPSNSPKRKVKNSGESGILTIFFYINLLVKLNNLTQLIDHPVWYGKVATSWGLFDYAGVVLVFALLDILSCWVSFMENPVPVFDEML